MANELPESPSEIIRRLLIDLGLGGDIEANADVAWPVQSTVEPDRPDNVITVYDTAGRILGRSMVDGYIYQDFGIQVRVRAASHTTGWLKADAIQKAMAERVSKAQVNTASYRYLVWCLAGIGSVLNLGFESPTSKRRLYTVNALATIRVL